MAVELINYVCQTIADERQLPVDLSEVKFLLAEQFTRSKFRFQTSKKLISSRFIVLLYGKKVIPKLRC